MPRPDRLNGRLGAAFDLLKDFSSVADIGCDHGKLIAALAARDNVVHAVASDISAPSLGKAVVSLREEGLAEKVSFRAGNGFSVLQPGECEAAAVLGLGGEEMVRMFQNSFETVSRMKKIVLQPMRGIEEIREFLSDAGFSVVEDNIIFENRRYYQLFSVAYTGTPDALPEGFPEGYFGCGYRSFEKRAPLLAKMLEHMKKELLRREPEAGDSKGGALIRSKLEKVNALLSILENEKEA